MSNFKIIAKDGLARVGILSTAHGQIQTPSFMPVGTQGSVKALAPDDLKKIGVQIILGNTYHLYLRPGSKIIKSLGGLHQFISWKGPILTDSGGFQAFSLGAMIEHGVRKVPKQNPNIGIKGHKVYRSRRRYSEKSKKVERHVTVLLDHQDKTLSKITDQGIEFISHLDGSKHILTPEKSIEVQFDLGSDIILVLDELLSPMHSKHYVQKSLERTHQWELKAKDYFDRHLSSSTNPKSLLFGILQGVYDQAIRQEEAKWVSRQEFAGVSIGGSFGTSKYWGFDMLDWAAYKAIVETLDWVVPLLPTKWPKHALGLGEVQDFFECIERGIDLFDCVAPTRRARNGSLYIRPNNGGNAKNRFVMSIQKAEYTKDNTPIDPGCSCYTCQNFSRAYLKHLYTAGEILYHRLATIHNVFFIIELLEQIKKSIFDKQFVVLKKKWLS